MRTLATLAAITLAAVSLGAAQIGSNAGATSPVMSAEGPASTNNDDSCDIAVLPAATLLLPYFEVDFNSPATTATTTLFSVTNLSPRPQIAHVTIWSDWAFPVLDFNLFLTGYDVQAINLYDVINRGIIAPSSGTSNRTTPGSRSLDNDDNPNFLPSAVVQCSVLPGNIPGGILQDIRSGLTTGTYSLCGTRRIGGTHANAIGYVTIDVIATCSTTLPTDPNYFSTEILFDNVLTGDYQQVAPNSVTGNFAQGGPMVHIRAIPEGGPAGSVKVTNLPYTFYDRYTALITAPLSPPVRTMDRRQPLPSTFAARWIQGGGTAFNTDYKIWREGVTGANASCSAYTANSGLAMTLAEIVRFDEHENPTVVAPPVIGIPLVRTVLPNTSRTPTTSSVFPPLAAQSGDTGGWMYLNLSNPGAQAYSVTEAGVSYDGSTLRPVAPNRQFHSGPVISPNLRQSQNWLIVSMSAEGRFAVDADATALANGCTPAPAQTNSSDRRIGPAPNQTP